MSVVLVGTGSGCRTFANATETDIELVGRQVSALAAEADGSCLALVNGKEIWRRDASGRWSQLAATEVELQSITSMEGLVFAGAMDEAAILLIAGGAKAKRLEGFDKTEGRSEWFAGGPPLGVRALTRTAGAEAILAAVHVGGMPRSLDQGDNWAPTIPVMFDVHDVDAHRSLSNVAAAATAVGLCLSRDGGATWKVYAQGFEDSTSLAVAVLDHEVLFSIQDGPFADRSQIWRCQIETGRIEQVRDGLPLWLDGKVDTGWIAVGDGRAAVVDGGGSLWLSTNGSTGWSRICSDLPYVFGLAVL